MSFHAFWFKMHSFEPKCILVCNRKSTSILGDWWLANTCMSNQSFSLILFTSAKVWKICYCLLLLTIITSLLPCELSKRPFRAFERKPYTRSKSFIYSHLMWIWRCSRYFTGHVCVENAAQVWGHMHDISSNFSTKQDSHELFLP